jgi:hypothetical protein
MDGGEQYINFACNHLHLLVFLFLFSLMDFLVNPSLAKEVSDKEIPSPLSFWSWLPICSGQSLIETGMMVS